MDAKDYFKLCFMYLYGNEKDYLDAKKKFEKAAAQGLPEAQCILGLMYYKGERVRQDYSEARKWYEKAAEQGEAQSQFNLGAMYIKGEGVRQDKRKAKEYFCQFCDNWFQAGCDEYRRLKEQGY